MALSGLGNCNAVEMVTSERAATAVLSWKTKKFWML